MPKGNLNEFSLVEGMPVNGTKLTGEAKDYFGRILAPTLEPSKADEKMNSAI